MTKTTMFGQETFDWMAAISLNNSREQFLSSKPLYDQFVRQPFIELLTELALSFGGTPKVFRPNRDIRFSADKSPYKTKISGFLDGAESTYYLDLSLDGFMAATGYYQMAKDQLVKYREALTTDESYLLGTELRRIVEMTSTTGENRASWHPKRSPKRRPSAFQFVDMLSNSARRLCGADRFRLFRIRRLEPSSSTKRMA